MFGRVSDYSDHRLYRHSQLAALEDRRERFIRCGRDPHHQYSGSDISSELGHRFRGRFGEFGRSLPVLGCDFGRSLHHRSPFECGPQHEERLCIQLCRNYPDCRRQQRIRIECHASYGSGDRRACVLRESDWADPVCHSRSCPYRRRCGSLRRGSECSRNIWPRQLAPSQAPIMIGGGFASSVFF